MDDSDGQRHIGSAEAPSFASLGPSLVLLPRPLSWGRGQGAAGRCGELRGARPAWWRCALPLSRAVRVRARTLERDRRGLSSERNACLCWNQES